MTPDSHPLFFRPTLPPARRPVLGAGLGVLCLALAACSSDPIGRTVPVSGKVTVNDLPLQQGSVVYWPDSEKGNASPFEAAGQIAAGGAYELVTRGKAGARPGWYRVTVMSEVPSNPKDIYSKPRLLVPRDCTTKETTPLSVEVVDSPAPGAYDLSVK